jgi:hypothetical protein
MSATFALREALNKGISSGSLVDTKVILYSHRDSSNRVCRPKALYANSHVLKTVPYFNDREYTATLEIGRRASYNFFEVLFGGFAGARSKDFKEETIDEEESAKDYGYSSDSDLEDDGDGRIAPVAVPHEKREIPCEEYEERIEKGKIVKIPDMALVT